MLSEALSDPKDPWETPPLELDAELIETSQRLVSLSEKSYQDAIESMSAKAEAQTLDPHILALEERNKFLFNRNIELTTKVATLETSNLRLQEQVAQLKQSQHSPWFLRWFQP